MKFMRLFVLAAVVSTMTLPAHAGGTHLAPPFGSTAVEQYCGMGALAASSADCDGTQTVSKSTGAVAADVHLISPAGGRVPWTADATSTAYVIAPAYHLAAPVHRLDFTVTIHVKSASLTLIGPETGFESQGIQYPFHTGGVFVLGDASHSLCSDCVGGASDIVLNEWVPGSYAASSRDFTLHFWMMNTDNKDVPAGDIFIEGGVTVDAWHVLSWGSDKAAVDAVVTGISID